MTEDEISRFIATAALKVHRTLGGPGLLEKVYEEALVYELTQCGLTVERQKSFPISYNGSSLATELRIDVVVAGKVIVECKAAAGYNPVFAAQALTYLRLSGLKLALVINFGKPLVKDGIRRVVNGL
jgi:GxxExxY protein